MADEAEWYPASWKSEDDDSFEPHGVRLMLEGGPLAGRSAHMTDRETSLWVAQTRRRGIVVTDWQEPPELPDDATLLGRYRFDADREVLIWRLL